jgi:hypothetical protein
MAVTKHDKHGKPYQLLSAAEGAEVRAHKPKLPTTPEGWVEQKAAEILEARRTGRARVNREWLDPAYDNWHLWIEYQSRSLGRRAFPLGLELTATLLPTVIDKANTVNVEQLAKETDRSKETVQAHLQKLRDLGADLSRLRSWPHPTKPT